MNDLPLPLFCDRMPERDRRALLNNREAYAAFYAPAKIAALEAECARLLALSADWLKFASDVRPGCASGEEWLDSLRVRTSHSINKDRS